nr:HAD family phosphatase [Chloroflexota bacterium]
MTQSIKALIFDMGGVLLRTESLEPRQRLAAKLGLSLEQLYKLVFESEEDRLVQLGIITPEERWQRIAPQLGLNNEEIAEFRREMFAGDVLDMELVNYIRSMRGRYKTALLSNAPARLEAMIHNEWHIADCFDVIVISALVKMMKPDPAIYRFTLNQLQVAPQEAVFIDDIRENVEAAAALGMHAIQFTTRDAALKELEDLLQTVEAKACCKDKGNG